MFQSPSWFLFSAPVCSSNATAKEEQYACFSPLLQTGMQGSIWFIHRPLAMFCQVQKKNTLSKERVFSNFQFLSSTKYLEFQFQRLYYSPHALYQTFSNIIHQNSFSIWQTSLLSPHHKLVLQNKHEFSQTVNEDECFFFLPRSKKYGQNDWQIHQQMKIKLLTKNIRRY